MPQRSQHFVGLDLGQASDFTALAVLERPLVLPEDPPAVRRPCYALRQLRRFPLGTHYSEITEIVLPLLITLSGAVLGVDQTGVGRAVVDMIADGLRDKVTCKSCPITITGGHEFSMSQESAHVPKKELVGVLQVLLQTRRLRVPRSLPETRAFVQEMENFRMKVPATRIDSLETWREGQHDDQVFAVAIAAWLGEMALPPEPVKPIPPMVLRA